jgi:hypothetical protein
MNWILMKSYQIGGCEVGRKANETARKPIPKPMRFDEMMKM